MGLVRLAGVGCRHSHPDNSLNRSVCPAHTAAQQGWPWQDEFPRL